jgi:hypothetical protein
MSANNRIFYACQAVVVAPTGSSIDQLYSSDVVHGLQSVGITTNFNLEQAFELGQLEIYENIEGIPDVEVTLEKVLDGYPLIYHLATTGATSENLTARSKQRCDLYLAIGQEERSSMTFNNGVYDHVGVACTGMYTSSVSYTIPVDGNSTESITLVGNNKKWFTNGSAFNNSDTLFDNLDGLDKPLALAPGSGGVQRREDVLLDKCILPQSIQGVNGTGVGNGCFGTPPSLSSGNRVHIQNITISTDFGREDIFELGRKTPYYRPAGFPIEVTCEIEAISVSGDFVTALEDGDPLLYNTDASGNNTREEAIFIRTRAGYGWDLGNKNRLTSVSYGGGDAGGGNVSCTYSYSNFNVLDIQHSGTIKVTKLGHLVNV